MSPNSGRIALSSKHMVATNIRNPDRRVRRTLKQKAARHGRAMAEAVRRILTQAVAGNEIGDLAALFRNTFGPRHGVDLVLPERGERPRDPFQA